MSLLLLLLLLLLLYLLSTFTKGIYSYIPETKHVSRAHSVAVLYLQFLQFISTRLHGVTSQKRENVIVIAMTKSNLTSFYLSTDYV